MHMLFPWSLGPPCCAHPWPGKPRAPSCLVQPCLPFTLHPDSTSPTSKSDFSLCPSVRLISSGHGATIVCILPIYWPGLEPTGSPGHVQVIHVPRTQHRALVFVAMHVREGSVYP